MKKSHIYKPKEKKYKWSKLPPSKVGQTAKPAHKKEKRLFWLLKPNSILIKSKQGRVLSLSILKTLDWHLRTEKKIMQSIICKIAKQPSQIFKSSACAPLIQLHHWPISDFCGVVTCNFSNLFWGDNWIQTFVNWHKCIIHYIIDIL
jgi:hypothetical protein